jgi:hypothetical protein
VRDATTGDQLVTDLGPTSLTRHGLRHPGAIRLADAGIPIHVLQDILGRTSIETTHGCLHADTRQLTDAAACADAFLVGHENRERQSPEPSTRTTPPRPR